MRSAFGQVNQRVIASTRPAWSVFDGPGRSRSVRAAPGLPAAIAPRDVAGFGNTRGRTHAALGGDLRGFGLNVPVPTTHAGRLANKVVARLMWSKQPVKLRWRSPTGEEPLVWCIYAAPRARENVLFVLRQVIGDVGQGDVQIRVHHAPEAMYAEDQWYVELTPGQLVRADSAIDTTAAPADSPEGADMGTPAWTGWAPKRNQDFGPRKWRAEGRPVSPYNGDVQLPSPASRQPEVPGPGAPPSSRPSLGPEREAERSAVYAIIATFRDRGEKFGLERAERVGPRYLAGARAWVAFRSAPEDVLAREIAGLRARIFQHRQQHPNGCATCATDRVVLVFLNERLDEVRQAVRRGETPAQAVADRAEVPVVRVPTWVGYSMFALALLGAIGGLRSSQPARAE